MRIARQSFALPFVGGFMLGAIGLVALQPAAAMHNLTGHLPHFHAAR